MSNRTAAFSSWMDSHAEGGKIKSMYTTGDDLVTYEFPDKATVIEWQEQVLKVKSHATDGVALSEKHGWTNNEVAADIYKWFSRVRKIEENYGASMVPPDIMRSVQNNNDLLVEWEYKPIKIGEGCKPPSNDGCQLLEVLKGPKD